MLQGATHERLERIHAQQYVVVKYVVIDDQSSLISAQTWLTAIVHKAHIRLSIREWAQSMTTMGIAFVNSRTQVTYIVKYTPRALMLSTRTQANVPVKHVRASTIQVITKHA